MQDLGEFRGKNVSVIFIIVFFHLFLKLRLVGLPITYYMFISTEGTDPLPSSQPCGTTVFLRWSRMDKPNVGL